MALWSLVSSSVVLPRECVIMLDGSNRRNKLSLASHGGLFGTSGAVEWCAQKRGGWLSPSLLSRKYLPAVASPPGFPMPQNLTGRAVVGFGYSSSASFSSPYQFC